MVNCYVDCFKAKRGQMKIQEMAFVLVAVIVFFGLVALLYFSIRMSGLKSEASNLGQDEAMQMAQRMSATPEFAWTAGDCDNCVDFDKVMALKDSAKYKVFWGLDYLKVERVYPSGKGECTKANYPNCGSLTLVEKDNFGTPPSAFVSLCRYDFKEGQSYRRCEMGKIYASSKLAGGTG